jgi:sugar phosphate isomerase/epimerase
MRPHLAICRHAAPDDTHALALALEAPCTGIEATLDPSRIGDSVMAAALLKSRAEGQLALRYHFPLGPLDISGPSEEVARDATTAIKRSIRSIALTGADYLTVHAALPEDAHGTARFAATASRLTDVVTEGRKHGVTVALENLRWGATAQPGAFLDLIEASGAAITFDVGHAVSSEPAARGFSAERFIAECGTRIQHAHVYDRESDRHHAPTNLDLIGGSLDALCEVGCPWWTIELFDSAEVRATRELLAAYLDERFTQAA